MRRGQTRSKVKTGFKAQLSRERGTVIKDWGGRLPIALVYPNSYYLGMSNLGMHAIYRLLNRHEDIVCERVFREGQQQPLLSVESQRPLHDFAVIAFSLSYELDYFNMVHMLKAANIPLLSAERDSKNPLIIAGGPCVTANPMPLAPFFDGFGIGEAEALLPGMLPVLSDGLSGNRNGLLEELSKLPGIYVPQHPVAKITRQWLSNLDDFPTNSVIVTPDTELGDLYLIEAERGCGHGCRFCLVHTTFSPMRFRSVDCLLEQAKEALRFRKRIGLVGPAVSEYPRIEELLRHLCQMGTGFAISSLRIGPKSRKLMGLLAQGGGKTVTLAPEAGSLRLRRAINKNIAEDDILQTITAAAEQGIRQVKLYFMLGLPSETDADIDALIKLMLTAKGIIDRQRSGTRLSINLSPFIPKAGTPFQRQPVAPSAVLNSRLAMLRHSLPARGIQIKHESPAWSQVQGVLSRGGTDVAAVLASLEETTLSGWRKTAEISGLDMETYAQEWGTSRKLPWDFIDLGTETEKLKCELDTP